MPKEYNVYGEITIHVDFDIEAETEEEAKAKAKEILEDYYRLRVIGAYHDNKRVKHNWDVDDYLEDDQIID